jgi:hypothetical protein
MMGSDGAIRAVVGRGGRIGPALLAGLAVLTPFAAAAGEADVVVARATCNAERICLFTVTVRHADTGWRHYADRFEVIGPDDTVLGTRVLQHPHVHEQPFTRTLAGVEIPPGVERVTVRAGDSVHAYGGRTAEVVLTFAPSDPSDARER